MALRIASVAAAVLMVSGCSGTTSPSSQLLGGTWAEVVSVPGAALVLRVDNSGNGSGTYAIEAGRSGTLTVSGATAASAVTLALNYDYGRTDTFAGTLTDSSHLVGSFGSSGAAVTFVRQ